MTPDVLMTTLLKMGEEISSINTRVTNHDENLFPKLEKSIDKIENKVSDINYRTIGLDSWKNGIIDLVIQEKEKVLATLREENKSSYQAFDKRVEILELRKKKGDEFVGEVKKTVFTKTSALIFAGLTGLLAWLMK